MNQVLERYLRCFVNDEQTNWHKLLRSAQFAYNNSRSTTTGETPFFALMGYEPELRLEIDPEDTVRQGGVPAVHHRLQKLAAARERMKKH